MKLLIALIFTTITFAQEWTGVWHLDSDVVLEDTYLSYAEVHLNGNTIYIRNGTSLSIKYLYGSGSIVSDFQTLTDRAGLSICSYDCLVTPIIVTDFLNRSIPESCNATLGVTEYTQQELELYGTYKVYDVLGRFLKSGNDWCNYSDNLPRNQLLIMNIYVKGNFVLTKKIVLK